MLNKNLVLKLSLDNEDHMKRENDSCDFYYNWLSCAEKKRGIRISPIENDLTCLKVQPLGFGQTQEELL